MRLAACGAAAAALVMTWANLTVGLLGPDDGWASRLLLLVPLAGLAGTALTLLLARRAGGREAGAVGGL